MSFKSPGETFAICVICINACCFGKLVIGAVNVVSITSLVIYAEYLEVVFIICTSYASGIVFGVLIAPAIDGYAVSSKIVVNVLFYVRSLCLSNSHSEACSVVRHFEEVVTS